MRWSQCLIPTLRDAPADAEVDSHKLMVKAGLIRRLGSGSYTYLPLGWRALHKVAEIVREEMNRVGAHEMLMPAMHPAELWKRTGRYDDLKEILLRLKDRRGSEFVLGPTHEEVIADLAAHEIRSYRDLPITLYQIQTKFRDEPRPRFGVMRCREFLMKDAYSFDADEEGLERTYRAMGEAYLRIFERCGLTAIAAEADSGIMGGDVSHDFMVPAPTGENRLVQCKQCGYSADLDRAEAGPPAAATGGPLPMEDVATPGMRTIDEVAGFLNADRTKLAKTLLYQTPDEVVAVMVLGDHDVNETKLARALGVPVELADEEAVVKASGCSVGFAGPVGLKAKVIGDQAVARQRNLVTGANRDDTHTINVNPGRDFDFTEVMDLRYACAADPCPRCSGWLEVTPCIEVGHIFELGTKYSEALGASFLDEKGTEHPVVMGCYGIGIARILAARIETHRDDNGIIWHPSIAPHQADVLLVNAKDGEVAEAGERAYQTLVDAGIDAILDDRDESAGVKFKDADLIGFPLRVTVGRRSLKQGGYELKLRDRDETQVTPPEQLVARARELLAAMQ